MEMEMEIKIEEIQLADIDFNEDSILAVHRC